MTQNAFLVPRPMGRTGLIVPAICVGGAPLGDTPETFPDGVSEAQAFDTIRAVFHSPITFVDTAAGYGESERRIGVVLQEIGGLPEGFVLATKADRDLVTGDFSGAQMRRSVENSLRLLGLDQIQLLYLHDPEHTTFEAAMASGGAVEALRQCQAEGMIAHLGVAGGPIDLLTRFVETGLFEVAISHNRYTLLNTEAAPFWDTCARYGVAAVNAAPYGSGILAKGPDNSPRYMYATASDAMIERTHRIMAVCTRYNVPLAAAALHFSLNDPRISSTIVGMSSPQRIAQTLALVEQIIPAELWADIAAIP